MSKRKNKKKTNNTVVKKAENTSKETKDIKSGTGQDTEQVPFIDTDNKTVEMEEKKELARIVNQQVVYASRKDIGEIPELKKRKKLRFTILFVPNNAHRVRQLQIGFDMIVLLMLLSVVLVVGFIFWISGTASRAQRLESEMASKNAKISELEDEIIVLQAHLEEVESSLRTAKVTIDATKSIQQQEAEKQTEKSRPSALPVDNAAAIPSKFTEDKQYVEFTAGFGSKVIAAGDGTVSEAGLDPESGNYVVKINHGNGYVTVYSLRSTEPIVKETDQVLRGSTLFVVDGDNEVLRYEVWFNEMAIDPLTIMDIAG